MKTAAIGARRHLLGAVLLGGALFTVASPSAQETSDYVVSDYQLTIDLAPDGQTARVTMDLTYRIRSGTKSEGFKYIGTIAPTAVEGSDSDGRPMQVTVEHQRETLIRWRFTPSGRGERRVQVRFTMPASLVGNASENILQVPWAGVFKVPVSHAVYRLVAPADWAGEVTGASVLPVRETRVDGRRAFDIEQEPLRETAFGLRLRSGLVRAPPLPAARAPMLPKATRDTPIGSWVIAFVFLLAVFAWLSARAKRGGPGRTQSGSTCSTSSCAGGSSCSSGCGGGGCGGGCGG